MDNLSEFRTHFHKAKSRAKKKKIDFNITLEYLKELWDKQKGICPITGWKMLNRKNSNTRIKAPFCPERSSLDRIEPNKGYVIGNVRFICLMAQYAKHEFSDKDLMKFCKTVAKKHANTRFTNRCNI